MCGGQVANVDAQLLAEWRSEIKSEISENRDQIQALTKTLHETNIQLTRLATLEEARQSEPKSHSQPWHHRVKDGAIGAAPIVGLIEIIKMILGKS